MVDAGDPPGIPDVVQVDNVGLGRAPEDIAPMAITVTANNIWRVLIEAVLYLLD